MRLFRMNGMGPHDGGELFFGLPCRLYAEKVRFPVDSLGGNLYWSAGASLISDIPRKPHWPVKTHLFLNAGRLDVMDKCTSPRILHSNKGS